MNKLSHAEARRYSKSEINRCGDILRDGDLDSLNHAYDVVSAWRAAHLYPLNALKKQLIGQVVDLQGHIIAQRLKRMPTIIAKLRRNQTMELSRMQDVGGLRVIVNDVREVKMVANYCLSGKAGYKPVRSYDYIKQPKPDGYRGVHLVFKYTSDDERTKIYDGLLIELQIRTKLQHTWATAVEMGGVMLGQKLKNDEGSDEWLKFFGLVSEAFAIVEHLEDGRGNSVPLERKTGEEVRSLYTEITALEQKLKVLEKLRAFSDAMMFLDKKKSVKQKFFIMEMRPSEKRVTIYGYNSSQYEVAVRRYKSLEQKNRDTDVDQVLVSANSLRQLRRAYPNYFVNIDDFVAKVQSIEQQGNM